MTKQVSQKTLWLQYMEGLSNQVKLKTGEALQLIYPYTPWDWGGRDPVANSFTYEQYQVLNTVPANPAANVNDGAAGSQSGFDNAYHNWFTWLALGDYEQNPQYQELNDQLTNMTTKYTNTYEQAKNQWKNQTGGTGEAFEKWLNDPGQAGLAMQISQAKKNMERASQQLNEYVARISGPIEDIQKTYNNTDYQSFVTDPNSGKSIQLRTWGTVPSNPYNYVEKITDNNFGGNASKGTPSQVTFNSETQQYNYEKTYGAAALGFDFDFIGIEAEGSYEKIDWSKFDETYEISIAFQDLVSIDVNAGDWFSGSNLTTYARGPYTKGFSEFNNGSDNYFFGEGGALCRIYDRLIAGYRPTITIKGGSSFATYMKEKWETESGIMIGPFLFGGVVEHTKEKDTLEVKNGEIIITSNSDWPMIVGMTSQWTIPPE